MPKHRNHVVRIEPFRRGLSAGHGTNLARLLHENGIYMRSDCGGKGVCEKCRVRVSAGTEVSAAAGLQPACRVEITSDMVVEIPLSSLIGPSEPMEKPLDTETYPAELSGGSSRQGFGIAVDLGTTTIAGFLCNYAEGVVVGSAAAFNPQSVYGGDVVSRITAAASGQRHLRMLRQLAVSALDEMARSLTENTGVDPELVREIVVVGNTTMLHLLLGIDPRSLGQAPFRPVFTESREIPAGEIGLRVNPGARLITLPLVSGFIGADLVSAALARQLADRADGTMLIDIGTNGEIILKANGGFFATSCATGPAFEGATIRHGMLAVPGAVESIEFNLTNDLPELSIIQKGSGEPVKARGICGSGLISIAAALIGRGIIEPSGRFSPHHPHPNLRRGPHGGFEFLLAGCDAAVAGDIVLTQKDIRSLQLAKGAIRTGIDMLCRFAGCSNPREILVAGSFGNHLRVDDLLAIGLLPSISAESVRFVGNAAGAGAVMAAIDPGFRKKMEDFARRVQVVELASQPDFQEIFLGSMSFPDRRGGDGENKSSRQRPAREKK